VEFAARAGEVTGLVGHNGAGKSTLIGCLSGYNTPDAGTITVGGRDVASMSVLAARAEGIRCVRQELSLPVSLSIAECAVLAYPSRFKGLRRKVEAGAAVASLFHGMFGQTLATTQRPLGSYPFSQRQMLEVCLAFMNYREGCRLVILDEATSGTDAELTARLLAWMSNTARLHNLAVVLTTHRLSEVVSIANRAVVMADGDMIATLAGGDITEARLVELMGGAARAHTGAKQMAVGGVARSDSSGGESRSAVGGVGEERRTLVHLDGVSYPPAVRSATLTIREGDLVGVGGLDGHGQAELLAGVFRQSRRSWFRRRTGATVPVRAAFVSADPRREGVFPEWSVRWNISLGGRSYLSRFGFVSTSRERTSVAEMVRRLQVSGRPSQRVSELSGGNQQKVVLARALMGRPNLLILNDPTRGIDIRTKQQIYGLFQELAASGCGVLWYSTELDELELCDRVHVVRSGRTIGLLEGDEVRHDRLVAMSFGEITAEAVGETAVGGATSGRESENV